ncbi:MAG: hypothetical protein RSE56_02815 [Bacilli bacterium]
MIFFQIIGIVILLLMSLFTGNMVKVNRLDNTLKGINSSMVAASLVKDAEGYHSIDTKHFKTISSQYVAANINDFIKKYAIYYSFLDGLGNIIYYDYEVPARQVRIRIKTTLDFNFIYQKSIIYRLEEY